jgi:predicted permease
MTRMPRGFDILLKALPPEFRTRHRDAMDDLMADYVRARSAWARTRIWARAAVDILWVGLVLRLKRTRTRKRSANRPIRAHALDTFVQDTRHSLRSLRRDYGLAALATLIVALGVGASSTVFSVGNALLLRPLPFDEPDRLVWIANGEWGRGQRLSTISTQVAHLWNLQDRSRTLTDVAGYFLFDWAGDLTLTGAGEPERLTQLRVTGNFFPLLGVRPQLGRLFTAEEAQQYGPGAIILSHGLWVRRFAADPNVVGSTLTLNENPVTVVGVLPASFDFNTIFAHDSRIDFVAPFPLTEQTNSWGNTLALIGRLAPGATIAAAQAEAAFIAEQPIERGRATNEFEPVLSPLRDHVSGGSRPAVMLLAGAVTLVMLIVCANLSNLLLARGATHEKEIAIRAALGAARGRLIRQMLTESAVLALAGGALGLVLAYAGTQTLSQMDANIQLLSQARVDGVVLAFTIFAAVAAGLVFGLTPALRLSGVALNESLKEGGRGHSQGKRHGWTRGALVVSEVALACVLLVGASLLIHSLLRVLDVDLGFQPGGVVTLRIDPPTDFDSQAAATTYMSEALRRVRSEPGVDAAALTDVLPVTFNRRWGISAGERRAAPYVRVVSEGYLSAMRLTLVSGRDFTVGDDSSRSNVVIVNELLANELWPGEDPLGKTLQQGNRRPREWEVVGVVRGMRHLSPEQEPAPEVFFPIRQEGSDYMAIHLVARGNHPLTAVVASVRAALRGLDSNLPLNDFRLMQDIIDKSTAPRRFLVLLLAGFAGFALLLASLGIYGVISYSVSQRSQEIGIRTALGASPLDLQRRVLTETLRLAVAGMVLGLLAAWALARVMQGLLFGVTSSDPITFAIVPLVIVSVAAVAGYLPARRAARLDPMAVLRADAGLAQTR